VPRDDRRSALAAGQRALLLRPVPRRALLASLEGEPGDGAARALPRRALPGARRETEGRTVSVIRVLNRAGDVTRRYHLTDDWPDERGSGPDRLYTVRLGRKSNPVYHCQTALFNALVVLQVLTNGLNVLELSLDARSFNFAVTFSVTAKIKSN
jgi:hypothetical protein